MSLGTGLSRFFGFFFFFAAGVRISLASVSVSSELGSARGFRAAFLRARCAAEASASDSEASAVVSREEAGAAGFFLARRRSFGVGAASGSGLGFFAGLGFFFADPALLADLTLASDSFLADLTLASDSSAAFLAAVLGRFAGGLAAFFAFLAGFAFGRGVASSSSSLRSSSERGVASSSLSSSWKQDRRRRQHHFWEAASRGQASSSTLSTRGFGIRWGESGNESGGTRSPREWGGGAANAGRRDCS